MSDILITRIAPWFVTALFIVVVFVGLLLVRELVLLLRLFTFKEKLLLVIICVVGFSVRWFMVPDQPRIYYDEDRYLTYAVTFARFGKQIGLNAATPTYHVSGDPDYVARITVPTLNAWVLKLVGYDTIHLFRVSKIFSSLQVPLLFVLTYALFKIKRVSFIATASFALIPTSVFWAVSIALDSYFVMFSLMAAVAATYYARKQDVLSSMLLISTTMLVLFVRFEAFLLLPVLVSIIFTIRKSEKRALWTKKDTVAFLCAVPFIGLRALVSISVLGKTWCCGEATPLEAFSAGYFIRNTIPNIQALFVKPEFPFIFSLAALYTAFGRKDIRILPLLLWIFFYFFVYSFYFAGTFFTFTFSGSYGRYFLMLIPPLLILAALSIDELIHHIQHQKKIVTGVCIITFITLLPTITRYPQMVYISPYDSLVDAMPRANRYFLEHVMLRQIPQNAVVVHPLTGLTLLHGRTAVYFGSLLSSKNVRAFVHEQAKAGVPIYIWQTHTCDNTPQKCEEVLKLFDIVPVEIKGENLTSLEMAQLILKSASEEATNSSVKKK